MNREKKLVSLVKRVIKFQNKTFRDLQWLEKINLVYFRQQMVTFFYLQLSFMASASTMCQFSWHGIDIVGKKNTFITNIITLPTASYLPQQLAGRQQNVYLYKMFPHYWKFTIYIVYILSKLWVKYLPRFHI